MEIKIMPTMYPPPSPIRFIAVAGRIIQGQVVSVTILGENTLTGKKLPVAQHICPSEGTRLIRELRLRDRAALN